MNGAKLGTAEEGQTHAGLSAVNLNCSTHAFLPTYALLLCKTPMSSYYAKQTHSGTSGWRSGSNVYLDGCTQS